MEDASTPKIEVTNPASDDVLAHPLESVRMPSEEDLAHITRAIETGQVREGLASKGPAEKSRESALARIREKLRSLAQPLVDFMESREGHPKTNILYRSDRMYRCIGPDGYSDLIKSGVVRSGNGVKYQDVSFNIGEPSPRYMQGDSGDYILEADQSDADFQLKANPYSFSGAPMDNIPYRSIQAGELTTESKIRVFKRIHNNDSTERKPSTSEVLTYEVVLDNIGDQALVETED